MRSIERYLLAWIIGALTLGSVLVALVVYVVILDEMNEVFDADLRNVANAVAGYHHAAHATGDAAVLALPPRTDEAGDAEIVTVTWTRAGELVSSSDKQVSLPYSAAEGLSRPRIRDEDWALYTKVLADGIVQAGQRVSARQNLASESAAKVLTPLLGLVVTVGGLLVFALRRGLQPLGAATRDIAARSVSSLDPISTRNVPREIAPLVASINDLMRRLSDAFSAQRRFLADAAHELRTPVTALRLQLQLLKRSSDAQSRAEAVSELESGVDRTQHLIEQLLQVARAEPDGEVTRDEPVSLGELVRSVAGTLSIKAEQRGIDLGVTGPTGIWIRGDAHQLTILLNNLVENALRYTPFGGVVDLAAGMHDGQPAVSVTDTGPGIPEAERGRVFDRFHRGEDAQTQARDSGGSGLGLAIVRAIADRHHAQVRLETPQSGTGLAVRVMFGDTGNAAPVSMIGGAEILARDGVSEP